MLTKFVSKILRVWFSFLATYFVISVCFLLLNKKVEKDEESWLNFALHCGYLLSYFNSVFNALIFLKMNKSQNLKIHVFCRDVRVRPQDPVRCRRQNQENVSWKCWWLLKVQHFFFYNVKSFVQCPVNVFWPEIVEKVMLKKSGKILGNCCCWDSV